MNLSIKFCCPVSRAPLRVSSRSFANSIVPPLSSSGIEKNPTVFYKLIRGSTDQTNKYDTFYLQQRQHNGWTHADVKVNHPLDYERIKEYNLTIRVEVCPKRRM